VQNVNSEVGQPNLEIKLKSNVNLHACTCLTSDAMAFQLQINQSVQNTFLNKQLQE